MERSSIIREPLVGRIDFTHRTFQEFLAAKDVLGEDDIGMLVGYAHNDQWREVVLLAFGLASNRTREEIVDKLIGQGDTDKVNRTRLYLLAATCLETSVEELGPNIKLLVQKRLSALIPPKNTDEAEALATVGELAVPYLARGDKYEPSTRAACVHALGRIGSDEALKMLEGYAGDDSEGVVQELWKAWLSFEGENRTKYTQRVLSSSIEQGPNYLSIRDFTSLDDFGYFTRLTTLSLGDCSQITDLAPLSKLTQLISLDLRQCKQIIDLSPLSALTQLTQLLLVNCEQLSDLSPLSKLTQLTNIFMWGNKQLSDLSPLSKLTQLTYLTLTDCGQFRDLAPLSTLTKLRHLNLENSLEISNLSPLLALTQLNVLSLRGCPKINDLGPLAGLNKLHVGISPEDSRRITIPQSLKKRVHITDDLIWYMNIKG